MKEEYLQYFKSFLNDDECLIDSETCVSYGHDETENLSFPPEVVLRPRSVDQISKILKFCNENQIALTPIGAQTGLSGGALCIRGGVGLSLNRLNKIIEIDERNHQVIVEPGVITQVLQEEVAKKSLYYAPDPASRGTCFIGGNIAENSGGPRALKYGVTKDWVLNLEVVLANGEVIWTGANTLKNSTGYNLTQLMVGSEGTLGIVTKAVLKLIPLPQKNMLMLAEFNSAEKACEAVAAIFRAGITPSALEFMEKDAIDLALDFVDSSAIQVPEDVKAHLLIEVDGNNEDLLMNDCERISSVLEQFDVGNIHFADSEAQKNELWQLRRKVGEAVKSHSIYKEEDTVVPRFELPKLLKGIKSIGQQYGFRSVCYGHAGDGNLHVNILKESLSDQFWNETLPEAIRKIFELTVSLSGTLSGEHGIGWVQKNYMDIAFNEMELNLMKGIKKTFDPNGILNPGKIFPD